jgi:hypothetical protein
MKHNPKQRCKVGLAAGLAVLLGCIASAGPGASAATRRHPARAARSINGTVTAHLHLVKPNGTELYEKGRVTGSLPGSMQAVLDTGKVLKGSFTIHTHGGSIRGRGTGTPRGLGRYQSFSGTITITGGSGRYRHARGRAHLYGTFDRRTYAVVIQTTGRFNY